MASTRKVIALTSLILIGATGVGSVFAATPEEVKRVVAQVSSGGSVYGHLKDGVVLLQGEVSDSAVSQRIEAAVRELDGVTDVENYIQNN